MDIKTNNNFVVEIFYTKEWADEAFQAAIDLGYSSKDINILMSDETRAKLYAHSETVEMATHNLTVGGLLGGAIGSTVGGLIALGSNAALPGLGLIIAGPLIGTGGIYGGFLGSLFGWSTPDEEALPSACDLPNSYNESLKNGGIILIIEEKSNKKELASMWQAIKEKTINPY